MSRLIKWIYLLRGNAVALYFAHQDPRAAWTVRGFLLLILFYILSPVDLVPDLIPVAGQVDDVVVVSMLITLATRFLPKDVLLESQKKSEKATRSYRKWVNIAIGMCILGLVLIIVLVHLFNQPSGH